MEYYGDTVVLKFESFVKESKRMMNSLYIFYDEGFVIRGCRHFITGRRLHYNHFFKSKKALLNYLKFIFCDENYSTDISMCMLNYPDLPLTSEEISYKVLRNQSSSSKMCGLEISGFEYHNNSEFLKVDIKEALNILENVESF